MKLSGCFDIILWLMLCALLSMSNLHRMTSCLVGSKFLISTWKHFTKVQYPTRPRVLYLFDSHRQYHFEKYIKGISTESFLSEAILAKSIFNSGFRLQVVEWKFRAHKDKCVTWKSNPRGWNSITMYMYYMHQYHGINLFATLKSLLT